MLEKLTRTFGIYMDELAAAAESNLLYAGIFSPDFGQREDIPNIILPDGFTAESVNILQQYGKLSRMRMRLAEMIEAAFANGTITATNGSPTITVSGGAGTWSSNATHKPYWVGRTVTITDDGVDTDYTISAVSDAGDDITLTTNYTGTGGAGLAYSIGTVGTKVAAPDGNTILHYELLDQETGGARTEYFYAFTKAHAYLWSTAWSAWMLKFTCGSDCTFWSTDTFDNQIIATNNGDKVQVHGATISNAFGNLTGDANGIDIGTGTYLTKAKYVKECQNYILLAGVTVGGTDYANDLYWCSYNDESDFDSTGTGDASNTVVEGKGFICGLANYGNDLFIGKTGCCKAMRLVTNANTWEQYILMPKVGVLKDAAGSIITDKEGYLYFIDDSYNIRRLPDAAVVSKAKDQTFKNIDPSLQEGVRSFYIDTYGLLLWSIPYGSGGTGNNKIVWFEPTTGKMGELDMAVAAFGKYSRQTVYTWGTLPFATWSAWDWDRWSQTENVLGFALDLCSDYSGHTYTMHASGLDDGSSYDGYFVLSLDTLADKIQKRYGISLRYFKKIFRFQLWLENEGDGTISISTKSDNETSWQLRGSGSLNGTTDIFPVDIFVPEGVRARHHLVKIHGSNRFSVLGLIVGFTPDGTS